MHLYNRGSSYYLVVNVPCDLIPIYRKKQIWVSLRTKDKNIANIRSLMILSKLEYQFLTERQKMSVFKNANIRFTLDYNGMPRPQGTSNYNDVQIENYALDFCITKTEDELPTLSKDFPTLQYYKNLHNEYVLAYKNNDFHLVQDALDIYIASHKMLAPTKECLSEEGEFIMAHTFGAYEAQEIAKGNGGWEVSQEEFFKRYEFYSVAEDGRAIFIAKASRYVWCRLFGDFIGCIPQWGDSMVAMSNPQVNITNPDDVYACSYIEFYGKEDIPGGYLVVQELFLGAPEHVVMEFGDALKGYLSSTFGIPKQVISASNLSNFLQETLGIPEETALKEKIALAVA